MQLNVGERILLLNVIPPAEGPYRLLQAVRKLRQELGFTAEEKSDLGIVVTPDKVSWDPEKNPVKDIEIGMTVEEFISKSILSAPSLKEEHMEFYSRFVKEGE